MSTIQGIVFVVAMIGFAAGFAFMVAAAMDRNALTTRLSAAGFALFMLGGAGSVLVGGAEVEAVTVTVVDADGSKAIGQTPAGERYSFARDAEMEGDSVTLTLNASGRAHKGYEDPTAAKTAVAAEQARPGTPDQRAATALALMVSVSAAIILWPGRRTGDADLHPTYAW